MRARLLAGFLFFAAIVGATLEVPLGLSLQSREETVALASVENGATSLALGMSATLESGHGAVQLARRYASTIGGDVVVSSGGRVLAAGGRDGAEELSDPGVAAIIRAAQTGRVAGVRSASESDDEQLYAAIPLETIGHAPGQAAGQPVERPVLLVAAPSTALEAAVHRDWIELISYGLVMVVVATIAGSVLARSLTRPLRRIETAVAAIGDGDLDRRAPTEAGPTELRDLAGTVNAMAGRIGELLEAQRLFVADASHQLRSPLTALRLRIENLERSTKAPDARVLTAMSGEIERLTRLVDGLLALARAEGIRPERAPVDVAAVLAERAAAWDAFAGEQGLRLELTTGAGAGVSTGAGPGTPGGAGARNLAGAGIGTGARNGAGSVAGTGVTVLACPGHLEQMLDNLLANAFEAASPGTTVELRVVPGGEVVEVHVVDHGPGMTEGDRQRAFLRFWRAEPASDGGSGLGLAIVEQLARASGGSVRLEAARGGGIDAVIALEAR